MTNQMIISGHKKLAFEGAKFLGAPIIGVVGLFSESNAKTLKIKMKTHAEIFIDDLVAHSQLWSGNSNIVENTASSSIQLTNSSGQ